MEFKIYERYFHDDARIVGSVEVENPQYAGKAQPCIEVHKNTGEIMDTYLLPVDSDFWADAHPNRKTHGFIVGELGGREAIIARLERIVEETKKPEKGGIGSKTRQDILAEALEACYNAMTRGESQEYQAADEAGVFYVITPQQMSQWAYTAEDWEAMDFYLLAGETMDSLGIDF